MPPAGLEHAQRLAKHLGLLGRQVDDAVGDHEVDRAVRDRQVLDLAESELDVGHAGARAAFAARLLDHRRRHVDADHAPGGSGLGGGEEAVDPGARAQIEHRLTRADRGVRERVPAPESQVRPLGEDRGLLRRIAQLGERVLRVRVAAATDARRPAATAALLRDRTVLLTYHRPQILIDAHDSSWFHNRPRSAWRRSMALGLTQ